MALQAAAHASIAALVRESPHDGARRDPRGPFGSQCLRAPVSRATGCRPFRRRARGRVAHLAIERSEPCSTAAQRRRCDLPPAPCGVHRHRRQDDGEEDRGNSGRGRGLDASRTRTPLRASNPAPHCSTPFATVVGTRPRSRRTRSTRGDDTTRAAPWTTTVPIRQPPLSPTAIVPRAAFRGPPRRPS